MELFDKRLDARICFVLSHAAADELRAAAEAAGVSVSAFVRECIRRGKPLVVEAVRRQRRQQRRHEDRHEDRHEPPRAA